jgi:NAD(P)-dependent dehydrogenase (short-subunit alcohol dehydrogenase family)
MHSMSGKVVLVTGAARRIGRVIALRLAREGADVAITYRDSDNDAAVTLRELGESSGRSMAMRCDIRDPDSVKAAVAGVVEEFGRLDLLVNNAGLFATVPLESITVGQWDEMFETNTRGAFLMAQAAHPHLKAARGRIVNIGSLGGTHPWATHAHYSTSKAALHMLTQTMSKAFAPEISVNCVAPGMIANGDTDAEYGHFAEKTPMRRNGKAEEVAEAVHFFATGPHFITGQILGVDGGLGL